MRILSVLFILAAVVMVYIRLAPNDPVRWNQAISAKDAGDYSTPNSYTVVRAGVTQAQFEKLADVAAATDRTARLAGSASEGRVTFVTRSRLMGYPDFTTLQLVGDVLTVRGRSRFGYGDHGVNKARVVAWMTAAGV